MHPRYLGLITNARTVTQAGREFYSVPSRRTETLHTQLQKWHYCTDQFYRPDPGYQVYPLFALFRILLGLPETQCTISAEEFRYFALPTKSFHECDDRIALVRAFRRNPSAWRTKIDEIIRYTYMGRVYHMLELSPYLNIGSDSIGLTPSHVDQTHGLLARYEDLERRGIVPYYAKGPRRYLEMLGSVESLFEFCESGK